MTRLEPLAERWLIPHPFACENDVCRSPIAWHAPTATTPGACDRHWRPAFTVPVAIWGYSGVGWCAYPMGVAVYSALARRGAFDAAGRTRPVAEWLIPPEDDWP